MEKGDGRWRGGGEGSERRKDDGNSNNNKVKIVCACSRCIGTERRAERRATKTYLCTKGMLNRKPSAMFG